jgi:hypothetical protein
MQLTYLRALFYFVIYVCLLEQFGFIIANTLLIAGYFGIKELVNIINRYRIEQNYMIGDEDYYDNIKQQITYPNKIYMQSEKNKQLQKKIIDVFEPELYHSLMFPEYLEENVSSYSDSESLSDYYNEKYKSKRKIYRKKRILIKKKLLDQSYVINKILRKKYRIY